MWWMILGCAVETPEQVVDMRIDVPQAPTTGLQLVSPPVEVAAYEDAQLCWFGTWDEDTSGVVVSETWQHPSFGHHNILFMTTMSEDEHPDGSVVDCSERETELMLSMVPLTNPTESLGEGHTRMTLPDGMAVRVEPGTRWVMQSHYINPTDQPVLLHDVVNLHTVPIDDVEVFAAPFAQVSLGMDIPANSRADYLMDCSWDQDVDVLILFGHMHEWGEAIRIDWARSDGSEQTLYEVSEWDPVYRDAPPILHFDEGELRVQPGDRFLTQCAWDNDTDQDLDFPTEMCVAGGMVYPADEPVICFD
jgi:hypothetical protein